MHRGHGWVILDGSVKYMLKYLVKSDTLEAFKSAKLRENCTFNK
jgi:hypothetical protein